MKAIKHLNSGTTTEMVEEIKRNIEYQQIGLTPPKIEVAEKELTELIDFVKSEYNWETEETSKDILFFLFFD